MIDYLLSWVRQEALTVLSGLRKDILDRWAAFGPTRTPIDTLLSRAVKGIADIKR